MSKVLYSATLLEQHIFNEKARGRAWLRGETNTTPTPVTILPLGSILDAPSKKICHTSSFEVMLASTELSQILPKLTFFSFSLGRLSCVTTFVVGSPSIFGSKGLKFLSWFLSFFGLFDKLFLSVVLDNSHTDFYLVEKVVPKCLEQYRQRHVCWA